LHFIKWFVT